MVAILLSKRTAKPKNLTRIKTMTTETYIIEKEEGIFTLVNGNSESENTWMCYDEAKEAMSIDDELQKEATATGNHDLYHENSQIEWTV